MQHPNPQPNDETERRFPRRFLLAVPGAAGAVGAAAAVAPRAEAAPGTAAWLLGGNGNVTTNGSNWLGTKNPAPLIIKTTATSGGTPAERMRVQPNGRVGIGTNAPIAPLDVKGSAAGGGVVRVINTNAGTTGAFRGISNAGSGFGGWFTGRGGGVWAEGVGTSTQGVFASGTFGVRAVGTNVGVNATGGSIGLNAVSNDTNSTGIRGDGDQYGVLGVGFYALYGQGEIGCYGDGHQYGLYAQTSETGVFSSGNPAGYFEGNVTVTGTVSRSASTTQLDHPLDPDNKWLMHAGVESPDRKTVYDGIVALDDRGEATVALPAYAEKLNEDFRYQLTCVGGHAPVYVAREVRRGRFRIAGGRAGLKVSWQVTGTRRDDYSRAHPLKVETDKSADERGTRMFVPSGSRAKPMPAGRVHRDGRLVDPRDAASRVDPILASGSTPLL
jgi:hypothetical protein